jgi:PAS domain S-box-containing protein
MNPRSLAEEIEERFRTLFQEAPVAYQEVDHKGIIQRVNLAACHLLGLEASEIVGRTFWDFVALEERDAARENLRRKISAAAPGLAFEREYIARDGTPRILEFMTA